MEEYINSVETWKKNQELQIKFTELNIEYNKQMIEIHSEQLANNLKALEAEKELLRNGSKQYEDYLKENQ